jgi:hypothetical protein
MAPPLKTFDAKTAKAWVGEGGMKQYFHVKQTPKPAKPRGRPPKRKGTITNIPPRELNIPALVPVPVTLDIAEGAAPVVDNQQKKKKSPTNWGKGEDRVKMEKAIHDSEDVWEWELVDNNADNMDGGVLETDDANYDDQDGKEYTHDTGLIDANVMDNDKSEDNELPARFK